LDTIRHEKYMKESLAAYQQDEAGANYNPDMINNPPHYNQGDIECIDAIESALGAEGFKDYCRGNAIKYLWRAELKHDNKDDWAKANWYIQRMMEGNK